MPGRLDGKTALITGVGGGIGRTAARLFAAEGATVVGCDLQDAATEETVGLVTAAGGRMTATPGVDLGDPDAAAGWVDAAAAAHCCTQPVNWSHVFVGSPLSCNACSASRVTSRSRSRRS